MLVDADPVGVFENTHLTDDASATLMSRLEKDLRDRPWVVLVTRREPRDGYRPSRDGVTQRLDLTPIGGALALAPARGEHRHAAQRHRHGGDREKAQGNPLFLKALVDAAAHQQTTTPFPTRSKRC